MRGIMGWLSVCAVAGLVLLAAVARTSADGEKVPLDKVPKAVLDTIKARLPDAEVTSVEKETENGKVVYDVELKQKDRKWEMDILEDGTLIEIEKEIPMKDLPEAVAKAIDAKYPKAAIKEVMEVYTVKGKDEKLDRYEVTIETAEKKTIELEVSLDGKSIKEG
jgi:Putative beta-lactamase-inhibitor-like, PepSY-like